MRIPRPSHSGADAVTNCPDDVCTPLTSPDAPMDSLGWPDGLVPGEREPELEVSRSSRTIPDVLMDRSGPLIVNESAPFPHRSVDACGRAHVVDPSVTISPASR
ncbi:hypothetical protein GCM10022294_22700 [Dietzia aurantiaca]